MEQNPDFSHSIRPKQNTRLLITLLSILVVLLVIFQARQWFTGLHDETAKPRLGTPRGDLAQD